MACTAVSSFHPGLGHCSVPPRAVGTAPLDGRATHMLAVKLNATTSLYANRPSGRWPPKATYWARRPPRSRVNG